MNHGVTVAANGTIAVSDIMAVGALSGGTFENDGQIVVSGKGASFETDTLPTTNNGIIQIVHTVNENYYGNSPLTGTGTIQLGGGDGLFYNSVASTQTVDFQSMSGYVDLGEHNTNLQGTGTFAGKLVNMVRGDSIYIDAVTVNGVTSYDGTTLVLSTSVGAMSIAASGSITGFTVTNGSSSAQLVATGSAATMPGGGGSTTADTVAGPNNAVHSVEFGTAALATLAAPLLAGLAPSTTLFVDTPGAATMAAGKPVSWWMRPVRSASPATARRTRRWRPDRVRSTSPPEAAAAGLSWPAAGMISFSFLQAPATGRPSATARTRWSTAAGNDTVSTGTGGSFVFLGAGVRSVSSGGADTVVGSSGSAMVSAVGEQRGGVRARRSAAIRRRLGREHGRGAGRCRRR